MFYIRVDGNEIIATGHVMRCISIAQELKRKGENTTFIIADERPKEMITNAGFSVLCLDSVWNDLDVELDKLIDVIQKKEISLLLVDTYYVTEYYLEELKKYTRIAYMDDLNSFIYPVDLLINYNLYAKDLNYKERYASLKSSTEFLLGSEYAPLRKEFFDVDKVITPQVTKVLITSGGTDIHKVIPRLLNCLAEDQVVSKLDYYVVLGRFNEDRERLEQQWAETENIHFLINIHNMSDYMKMCDVAITAGGVTTYELCACGIPSVMYTLADNQLQGARYVQENEIMLYAGDVRKDADICVRQMIENLNVFVKDEELRKSYSERMKRLVDGKGCQRLVDELMDRRG